MKKILALVLLFCMVLCLSGCSAEAEKIGSAAMETAVTLVARMLEAVIAIAGTWLIGKLRQKTNLMNLQIATEQVIEATQQTVGELQQTVVNTLKEHGGGKLTQEQIRDLNIELLRLTRLKLADPVMNVIEAAGADLDLIIQSEAEAYLNNVKNGFWNVEVEPIRLQAEPCPEYEVFDTPEEDPEEDQE